VSCSGQLGSVFNRNQIAILSTFRDHLADRVGQIRPGDSINQFGTKFRIAIETVCLFGVALKDHLNITLLLNVEVVNSAGLLNREGTIHCTIGGDAGGGSGGGGHDRFRW
jgi:hypothetical protein